MIIIIIIMNFGFAKHFRPADFLPVNKKKVPPRISLIITDVAASVVLFDFAVQNLHNAEFVLWI